jgi:SAM-dependent methyltransferase
MLRDRPAWLPSDDALRRFYGTAALYPFYRLRLTEYISRLLPEGPCRILDVGAGDGSLGLTFQTFRPSTSVVGIEVAVRKATREGARLVRFDGRRIPFRDRSFDVALLSNVLHHAADADGLLGEVWRVTRKRVIVKDHLSTGRVDDVKLAALDVLGNLRLGAQVGAVYLSQDRWGELFRSLPGARVSTLEGLAFRRGLLERLFSNKLEIMFTVDAASWT